MSDTFTLRSELEREFVAALLSGIARKNCDAGDALAVCPVSMLSEGGIPWAAYRAVEALHRRGVVPTLHSIYAHMHGARSSGDTAYPPMTAADVGALAHSNFGHEDGVKHYAALMRREGLKRKAESILAGALADSQRYGNDPADMATVLRALASEMEGGVQEGGEIGSVLARVLESAEKGTYAAPLPTPWHTVNRVLKGGIVPGELAVLAARPGLGKTALAGCMAVETARGGHGVLFISREVRDETIAARMLAREARIDNRVFRQGIGNAPNVMPAIRSAAAELSELPLRIVEKSTVPMTPVEIRRQARGTKNIGLVVIDYLQLVTPDQKHSSREREVAEMSRAFKQLALDCECPVLLLSQLNRAVEESDRCPKLFDLRESGAIEQDADIVMFLHTKKSERNMVKAPVQVEVAKGRSSGTGTAFLMFDKVFADFTVDAFPNDNREPAQHAGNDL